MINLIFAFLEPAFICFYPEMAVYMSSNSSKKTSRVRSYLALNPFIALLLCCPIRLGKSLVTPVYSVPSGLLVRIYIAGCFFITYSFTYTGTLLVRRVLSEIATSLRSSQ